jgi:hypothetical protein
MPLNSCSNVGAEGDGGGPPPHKGGAAGCIRCVGKDAYKGAGSAPEAEIAYVSGHEVSPNTWIYSMIIIVRS